jgi:GNAT superfamily N-acetyltransferase
VVEAQGTCSTKHGALVSLAGEVGVEAELRIGLFPLSGSVAPELQAHGLSWLPEMHTYCAIGGRPLDLTSVDWSPPEALFFERPILPSQLVDSKPRWHRRLLGRWARSTSLSSAEALRIREACIEGLATRALRSRSAGAAFGAVPAERTHDLRHRILRPMQQPGHSRYPGDDHGLHLAAWRGASTFAVGSILADPRPAGPRGGFRVRGMAVDPGRRSQGWGRRILRGLVAHAALRRASEVWCNARTGARTLYEREGFEPVTEVFDLPPIGPHVTMVRRWG